MEDQTHKDKLLYSYREKLGSKCIQCGENIPSPRKARYGKRKYCSKKCIKIMWYINNRKVKYGSMYKPTPEYFTTATAIGLQWEMYVAKAIGANHIARIGDKLADIEKDGIYYDVKASSGYIRKRPYIGKKQWVFKRNNVKSPDFYFLLCLENNKKILKAYRVPGKYFPKGGCTIGQNSPKYDKWLIDL